MEATLLIVTGCLTAALVVISKKWGKDKAMYEYEIKGLRERLDGLEEVIRRKNAYAKELETHLLDNAVRPEQLADVLTGMFVDEKNRRRDEAVHPELLAPETDR